MADASASQVPAIVSQLTDIPTFKELSPVGEEMRVFETEAKSACVANTWDPKARLEPFPVSAVAEVGRSRRGWHLGLRTALLSAQRRAFHHRCACCLQVELSSSPDSTLAQWKMGTNE